MDTLYDSKTKTAFCPSEPKYHMLLIDIFKEARWTDMTAVKEGELVPEDTQTKPKILSVRLDYKHTHCSTCLSKFSTDTDSKDENIRKHLPVLSSSKTCDHYFCHGCILRRQAAIAEENNGRVPKWIPCMVCNTKTAFCPSEPKYHRLLIDIIKQANWTDAPQIKEEPAD